MISSYGTQATGAASIVSTLQSFIVSPTVGFLAATGTCLGAAKKQTDLQRRKKDEEGIIKIALLSCVVLGVCNSAVFLATKPLAPMWFDQEHRETAKYVSDFFVPLSLTEKTDLAHLVVRTANSSSKTGRRDQNYQQILDLDIESASNQGEPICL